MNRRYFQRMSYALITPGLFFLSLLFSGHLVKGMERVVDAQISRISFARGGKKW